MADRPRIDVAPTVDLGDVIFDGDDAALLRAIDETGSLSAAADTLGRSYAHSLRRIQALEETTGELTDRVRGGTGGGGSELTDRGHELLVTFSLTARLASTIDDAIDNRITCRLRERRGGIAEVDCPLGNATIYAPGVDTPREFLIPPAAITIHEPGQTDGSASSACNRLPATVASITRDGQIARVTLDCGGQRLVALVTDKSAESLDLREDRPVEFAFKATAVQVR